MKDKLCLPLQLDSQTKILRTIERYDSDFAYFEIWLDYLLDLDNDFLPALADRLGKRLIVVFRRQNLEPITMPMPERQKILQSLNNSLCYIDLDIASQTDEIEYTKQQKLNLRTIVSYHNYNETPDDKTLQKIQTSIAEANPTIIKIATMCKSENDALRLLRLLLSIKQSGNRPLILGMGEHGAVTRIFGTLWGNELIFAPAPDTVSTAPGQLSRQDLIEISNILKG